MSLSERLKSRRTPEPLPGLSRSRSFAGLLAGNQHRRTASATANFASLGSTGSDAGSVSSLGSSGSGEFHHRSCNGSSAGGSISASSTLSRATTILGQSHSPNTTRRLLQGFSATWGGKPPPAPRPQRAVTIFQAIEKGLRECIQLTQKDITNLKSSVDSLSVNSSQQLKTAERYLKRLEYQAAKLEELSEQYDVQQRMRDGVRNMAYAYVLNPGKERDSALHNVRSGFKECTDVLCGIETELERMMGTLMFQLKGIQGFARLCAGDVFEITVKHGEQKWKTRGRILKNEKQIWDNPRAIFKALMGEMLYIKAVEVRTLSKNVLLGHKYCETKDLFSAHPQMMTVNLNPSGSLKLHVVITWNPLHGCQEELSPKPMPPLLAALQSPMIKRRAPIPPNSSATVQEDLLSPNGPLPNGRSMVCIPPLLPPSSPPSSISPTSQMTSTLSDASQDESVGVLDFTEENDSYSCNTNVSRPLDIGCMQNCVQDRSKNGFLVSDSPKEELNTCMLEDSLLKNHRQDSFEEDKKGAEFGSGEVVQDLHVNFKKVHDAQSLYGVGYQSSGYESQSRNGSTWRSVHFKFDTDCDGGSFVGHGSCRVREKKPPKLYEFLTKPQTFGPTRKPRDFICDSRNTNELKSKIEFKEVGLATSYKTSTPLSVVKFPSMDMLNSNVAQHRLACFLEYR